MPILENKKLIFIHVPKTGGSSIEKVLDVHPSQVDNPEFFLSGGPSQLQHLTLSKIIQKKQIKTHEYTAFGVIRNPFERMVSEYKWRKKSSHPIVQNLDLNQFVSSIYEKWMNPDVNLDSHFTPQSDFFEGGNKLAELHIFKFEKGFHHIEVFMSSFLDKKIDLPIVNHTNDFQLVESLDKESKKIIENIFPNDFELWESL